MSLTAAPTPEILISWIGSPAPLLQVVRRCFCSSILLPFWYQLLSSVNISKPPKHPLSHLRNHISSASSSHSPWKPVGFRLGQMGRSLQHLPPRRFPPAEPAAPTPSPDSAGQTRCARGTGRSSWGRWQSEPKRSWKIGNFRRPLILGVVFWSKHLFNVYGFGTCWPRGLFELRIPKPF